VERAAEAEGYERFLFHDVRWGPDGRENPEFVLNRPGFRGAQILVPAENFGCGSSREMAVWALQANGVRAVIAPSLGDIFFENCFRNGVLAVILPAPGVAHLGRQLNERPGATVTVDLEAEAVTAQTDSSTASRSTPSGRRCCSAGRMRSR
jgi:3-isopropylmalate/(R)-2-methylmalate dehydratase small subunit